MNSKPWYSMSEDSKVWQGGNYQDCTEADSWYWVISFFIEIICMIRKKDV